MWPAAVALEDSGILPVSSLRYSGLMHRKSSQLSLADSAHLCCLRAELSEQPFAS